MHARIFTPEDAEGFSARELAEMDAAYARLGARHERAAGHERLCTLIEGVAVMLRGRGWTPSETDIVGEIERRELVPPE